MTQAQHKWTLDRLRRAGLSHLKSAEFILERLLKDVRRNPTLVPASVAYLTHVALEWGIKAQLLSRGGVASVEELAEKQPEVHDALFRGKKDHDIGTLARHLRIKNLIETNGKSWKEDECWMRISSSERPYSLRYGAEQIEKSNVDQEFKRISDILEVQLSEIKIVPLRKKKSGAK